MQTKMISLDPSSTITGWALYTNGRLTDHNIIDYQKEKDAEKRLFLMKSDVIALLKKHEPLIVVAEVSRSNNNIKVQRMLSELTGVIEGYALINNSDFVTFAPNSWRKFVKDDNEKMPIGRENLKPWDIEKTKYYFPNIELQTDDEADAILIGLARIRQCDKIAN